ncbi:MAE_28990/MAE_18760 family HEPN-like nuclease, partial [Agrobacterium tumefaciens]|uniref:MAE_28990/MAE_18760 family HEPN-like nuclease n=1 Tax=Agrobacterium tumefaciens TaxID=358 RepID=UPI003BA327E4
DLSDRQYSIGRLLDHIEEIGNSRGKVEVIVVLKSSVFIALYNTMEATIYSVVEKIHDLASSLEYDQLSGAYRNKMLRYSLGKRNSGLIRDANRVNLEEISFRDKKDKFPGLSDYLRRQSLFSGNIDARQIRVIAASYGVSRMSFSKRDAEKMLWIKNKRNKIAHGEQSMSDGGKGIKTDELHAASQSIDIILRTFIAEVGNHLRDGQYRA